MWPQNCWWSRYELSYISCNGLRWQRWRDQSWQALRFQLLSQHHFPARVPPHGPKPFNRYLDQDMPLFTIHWIGIKQRITFLSIFGVNVQKDSGVLHANIVDKQRLVTFLQVGSFPAYYPRCSRRVNKARGSWWEWYPSVAPMWRIDQWNWPLQPLSPAIGGLPDWHRLQKNQQKHVSIWGQDVAFSRFSWFI